MKTSFLFFAITLLSVAGIIFAANKTIPIDWNALTSIATLMLALITLGMVVTSYMTIEELRETRKASLKPELIITNPIYRYEFRWIPKDDLAPIIRPELKAGEVNQYETRLPVFGIKNIGMAPAVKVSVSWEIDSEKDINELKSNVFIGEFKPSCENNLFCLSRQQGGGVQKSCFRVDQRENTTVPFVVASPTNDAVQSLPMPAGISGGFDVNLITKPRPKDFGAIMNDLIRLHVRYEDLDGRVSEKKFVITSHLMYLSDSVSSDSNSIQKEHFSNSNVRGAIRFEVKPEEQTANV